MAIDYGKLHSFTARRFVAALQKDGFSVRKSKKDATRSISHPDGRRVTIHLHRLGQTLKVGTLQKIIEKAPAGPQAVEFSHSLAQG